MTAGGVGGGNGRGWSGDVGLKRHKPSYCCWGMKPLGCIAGKSKDNVD